MFNFIAGRCPARHLAGIVDRPRLAVAATKRPQVLHLPIAPEKGMAEPVVTRARRAHHLSGVIDPKSFAPTAAQRPEILNARALAVEERVRLRIAGDCCRSRDLPAVVDPTRDA